MRRCVLLFILLAALLASGCWSSTRYTTAKTLDPGQSEFGFGFSALNVRSVCAEITDETTGVDERDCADLGDSEASDLWIPNLLPDFFVRFALLDDLDLGFLVHFIGASADVRWRFFHTDQFHVAIAPRLSVQFPLVVMREYNAELPLIFTADFGAAQVYASIAGNIGMWSIPFTSEEDVTTGGFSGVLGLQLGTPTWFIRPEFGYTKHFLIASSGGTTAGLDLSWIHAGAAVGFNFGGE